MEICLEELPEEYEVSKGHKTLCWLEHEQAPNVKLKAKSYEESDLL
jgi:oligopeptide transport system ATP-binding protein